jgi:hypothetical protein
MAPMDKNRQATIMITTLDTGLHWYDAKYEFSEMETPNLAQKLFAVHIGYDLS